MIEIRNISYSYPNQILIFQDFTWNVHQGETWAILGPSGCGKSTLLYLLTGLLFPNEGEILINGALLERPRPHTGLIIQEYGLLPWATVRQNVELGQRVRIFYGPDGKHTPKNFQPEGMIDPWLERLKLIPLANKYPSQLSGGQRQRTAIARTLVLKPDLLLMDEPFSSLDAPNREKLQNLILELQNEQNLTLLIVTHSIEEAAILGKKILLLRDPPIQKPHIIDNPGAGSPSYREKQEYIVLCRGLRELMESKT